MIVLSRENILDGDRLSKINYLRMLCPCNKQMCCGIEIFRSLETENVTEGFEVAPAGLFDQTAKRVTFSRLPAQTEMLQTVSCYNSSFSPPYRGIYTILFETRCYDGFFARPAREIHYCAPRDIIHVDDYTAAVLHYTYMY